MARGGRGLRTLGLAALVLFVLAAIPSVAGAQKSNRGQVARLVGSKVHSPIVSADPLVLRLPVVLRRGIRGNRVTVELLDVAGPSGRQVVVFDRFKVLWQKPRTARGPAVLVSAKPPALKPGTYKLRVTLRYGRRSQRMAFQIQIAAAELRQPGTIRIRRTERWPAADRVEAHLLPLRESGGRSQITNISVKQIDPLRSGTTQASGSIGLAATKDPLVVPPGGFVEAKVEPRGSFPIGTSAGKAEIDASELAKPTELDVEVTQVLTRWYLVATLCIAVLLGWLTRAELVQRIKRAQANAQIEHVLGRVRRARARYSDKEFTAAMNDIEDDLLAARETEDAAAIEEAVTQAEAARQEALKTLKERADAASKELKELAGTLAIRRDTLPADLAAALEGAQGALGIARVRLDAGDIGGATELITSTRRDVNTAAEESGRAWKAAATPFVGAYTSPNRTATASADAAVLAKAEAARAALAAFKPEAAIADQLAALLAAIDAVDSFVQTVASISGGIVTQVSEILVSQAAEELVSIRQSYEVLRTALTDALHHAPDAYGRARVADERLATEMATTIEELGGTSGTLQAVMQALEAGGFVAAARSAVLTEQAQTSEIAMEIAAATTVSPVRTAPLEQAADTTVHAETNSIESALPDQSSLVLEAARPFDPVHQHNRRELYKATLLQTLLLGLVIVIVGYLALVDQWTGTTANFVAAFVAGYLADLSLDAVKTRVEGLKGGTAAPPDKPAGGATPPAGGEPAPPAGPAENA